MAAKRIEGSRDDFEIITLRFAKTMVYGSGFRVLGGPDHKVVVYWTTLVCRSKQLQVSVLGRLAVQGYYI